MNASRIYICLALTYAAAGDTVVLISSRSRRCTFEPSQSCKTIFSCANKDGLPTRNERTTHAPVGCTKGRRAPEL